MFSKQTMQTKPAAVTYLQESMGLLSNRAIRQTDRHVILQAKDASEKIPVLKMPTLALKGKEDYVPAPETLKTFGRRRTRKSTRGT
ncbi:MAG: hypothetical protein AAF734_05855 [Bacteroidota bacterium]